MSWLSAIWCSASHSAGGMRTSTCDAVLQRAIGAPHIHDGVGEVSRDGLQILEFEMQFRGQIGGY
jgi:hypothetical protein